MTDWYLTDEDIAPDAVHELSTRVIEHAASAGLTVATAESLTAGLLSSTLADISGASAVLRGGLIVYATELKSVLAGVAPELLAERGSVDPDVALQLARGAQSRCVADIGIGLTGVAGPTEQDGHAVGTVYCAISSDQHHAVRKYDLSSLGGRQEIRRGAVVAGLLMVADRCEKFSPIREQNENIDR